MKKNLMKIWLLTVCMLVSGVVVGKPVRAEEGEIEELVTDSGLKYAVNEDESTVTITGITDEDVTTIVIPSEIDGKQVTKIGNYAFEGCSSLTSIEIPSGVTKIGEDAFCGCSSLASIEIPSGVTEIDSYVFASCSSLTSIEIPSGVTKIGSTAFSGCSSLTSIEIPSGVTKIGSVAFSGCSSLTSIEIPSGVTEIGSYTFEDCSSLTSIKIPSGVTKIGSSAFEGCSNLTSIGIPSGVTKIGSSAFEGCSNLTSIEIPSGVTEIGNYAFSNCSSLTSVEIPSGVTKIGSSVFSNCSNLTSIEIPSGVTEIGNYAFSGCSSLTSIEIPSGVTKIGYDAFNGCSSLTSIKIPNGVTEIGSYTFEDCSGLTSIEIPSGVTEIGSSAFSGCSSLTSIEIPSGVTEIGYGAFSGCSGLTSIEIPSGVTEIGEEAFSECNNLESVSILGKNVNIGSRAFYNCTKLSSISISGEIDSIPLSALSNTLWLKEQEKKDFVILGGILLEVNENYSSLTSIEIPAEVTKIGKNVFSGWSSLTSIEIPSGVTKIGYSAFSECNNLESVSILGNNVNIGDLAFYNCTKLSSISVSGEISSIPLSALSDTLWLNEQEEKDFVILGGVLLEANKTLSGSQSIPEEVTTINDSAFESCTDITAITIPESVTKIGGEAFCNCTNMTEITIPESVTDIGWAVFYNCNSNLVVHCKIGSAAWTYAKEYNISCLATECADGYILEKGIIYQEGDNGVWNVIGYTSDLEESVTIPATIQNHPVGIICQNAFSECDVITELVIEDGVSLIGQEAFSDCRRLTKVTIPGSVTDIYYMAFGGCVALSDVSFSEGLKLIGEAAFYECKKLETVTIPQSVQDIYGHAFYTTKSITLKGYTGSIAHSYARTNAGYKVTFESNGTLSSDCKVVDGICYRLKGDNYLVFGCLDDNHEDNVTIPAEIDGKKVTAIDSKAFVNCSKLVSMEISDGIESIGAYVYDYCDNLETITVPESATKFGGGELDLDTDNIFGENIDLKKLTVIGKKDSKIYDLANYYGVRILCTGAGGVWTDSIAFAQAKYPMTLGETKSLDVVILPEGATEEVKITSSDEKIVKVNSAGLLTAVGVGTVTITATTTDGTELSASCEVEVTKADVTGITLNKTSATVEAGNNVTLTATIAPENASVKDVTWSSDKEDVATVDQTGKVTAVAEGTAVITVTSVDDDSVRATCTITVTKQEETGGESGETNPGTSGETTPETPGETTPGTSGETTPETPGSTTPENPGNTSSGNTTTTTPGSTTQTTPGGSTTQTPSADKTSGNGSQTVSTPAKVNTKLSVTANKCEVKVVSADTKNPTVSYVKSTNAKAKTISIPDTVTVDDVTYKVVSVADNAVQKNKKVTTITLGKNVTSIGKNAFKGCTSLKTVNIKSSSFTKIGANAFSGDKKLTTVKLTSTKLTSKSVGKNAFKGTNKKLTIKVPKKKVSSYKKYFKNKGNKTLKVKKG